MMKHHLSIVAIAGIAICNAQVEMTLGRDVFAYTNGHEIHNGYWVVQSIDNGCKIGVYPKIGSTGNFIQAKPSSPWPGYVLRVDGVEVEGKFPVTIKGGLKVWGACEADSRIRVVEYKY